MIQSDEVRAARQATKGTAEAMVFDPTHTRGGPEGGCLACDAQGTALARACAASAYTCSACGRDELTCSKAPCAAVIKDRSEGDGA